MPFNFKSINPIKTYLIIANISLVFFLILLSNLDLLPFRSPGDFWFFSFLVFALALYRPGWAFLFFVGTVALENITLAPESLNLSLRPYQLFGGAVLAALSIRVMVKRVSFLRPAFRWPDYLFGIIILSGFVSSLLSREPGASLRMEAIFASFFILYILFRVYLQDEKDVKKIIPFLISSALVILGYGIWQNIRFTRGLSNFEVMPGRPNATFSEPDWLGMYLVLLIALTYSLIWYLNKAIKNRTPILNLFLFIFLTSAYILLILTVSRSAWAGVFFATIMFLFIILTDLKINFRTWKWRSFLKYGAGIGASAGISVIIVYLFSLTSFQLFNRVRSATSGLQKITLACAENSRGKYPREVKSVEESEAYGCRHINLEDIEKEKSSGSVIMEAMRPDPNVSIRKTIYQKSWDEIKARPIAGTGWGNIGKILGNDERGATLNSSNIFIEVWLGSGIAGLLAFTAFWGWILAKAGINFSRGDGTKKYLGLFIMLGSAGLIAANLFNAGIFLGILYLFFAIAMV